MLWHRHFAQLIESLVEARAGAIGLDFIFEDIQAFDPDGQRALTRSLLLAGQESVPIVLGYRVSGTGVHQPPAPLAFAASAVGHSFAYVNLTGDNDDFIRRQELTAPGGAGFALAIANAFSEKAGRDPVLKPEDPTTMLVNYRERGHFRQVSMIQVMNALAEGDEEFAARNIRDRIILVGRVGEQGGEDFHSTPQYSWPRTDPQRESLRTPGIEIHASTISTLLDGNPIREMTGFLRVLIVFVIVSIVTLLCFSMKPTLGVGLSALVLGLFVFIALRPAFEAGHWLLVVSPVAGGVLAIGLSQTSNYVSEGRQRQQLRSLFSRYVDDRVVDRISQAPEDLNLGGERRDVAVLFADIVSFSTRSENADPAALVRDLNQYFESSVQAIQSRGGMVDKFMGDGIMALFGVPLEDPDHSLHAVEAAVGMVDGLERLKVEFEARGVVPFQIGIGVHCEEAIVGNVGSSKRMEYTAIGDVVNTAARIEYLTRRLDVGILISGDVFSEISSKPESEAFVMVNRGMEPVKGRKAAVEVYEVTGRKVDH